jgi:hypothetical protein
MKTLCKTLKMFSLVSKQNLKINNPKLPFPRVGEGAGGWGLETHLLRTFLRTPIKKPLIIKDLTEKMRCGREYQIVS